MLEVFRHVQSFSFLLAEYPLERIVSGRLDQADYQASLELSDVAVL